MKKSAITTIYYGHRPPFERKPPVHPSETTRGRVQAIREALVATFTPEQAALLEAYDTALSAMAEEGERERFAEGFRMGMRLGAECFGEA